MDLDRKKKIAIIASIIGGSVIILVICVWVLVAAITNSNNNNKGATATNTYAETATPTEDLTPSPTQSATVGNSPSEIIDNTPSSSPTVTPTQSGKIPEFSSMIKTNQLSYNSDKKTTEVEVNFQIDEPGKVYIIAVDSSRNFNPTSQQVKEHLITGELLSHTDARRVESVNKNDASKSTFVITVGFNKVDIFIVLESESGATSNKPTKLTFTPSVPTIDGDVETNINDRDVQLLNVKLTGEGYINALFVKGDSILLNDVNRLIAVAKGENNSDLLFKYRSNRISSVENVNFRISDNVNMEDLQNSKIVLLVEAPNGSFDKIFKVISFQ